MTKRQKRLEKIRQNTKNVRFAELALPYPVIITPDEDGGFGVEVVDLPGCVTYADSWEDIPLMVREAISSWIGSALKHGDPIPEPQSITAVE